METRKNYCLEYLVTKAKMPRQRTCCPFMQRTLYRVTRNLARLDLGFTCPDYGPESSSESPKRSTTPPPSTARRKRNPEDRRGSRASSRILSWLVRGAREKQVPQSPTSGLNSDTLSSLPPVDSNDDDTVPQSSRTQEKEVSPACLFYTVLMPTALGLT